MTIRRRSVITVCCLGVVLLLALSLLGRSLGAEWPDPPPDQPEQIWSKVDYDSKLTDTFFESDEESCPDGSAACPTCKDGEQLLKHTAKCFSTSFGVKHLVRFCQASLLDAHTIDLFLNESNRAFRDSLKIRIRNGKFTCQYWIVDSFHTFTWRTTRQQLTLDKKVYRKGDSIKGRIYFECLKKVKDPKIIEREGWPRDPTATIKVFGVFKTVLE
ncbi:MAG: hypothetical protein AB1664_03115 [Thermodesulfobacteriota bacterium]